MGTEILKDGFKRCLLDGGKKKSASAVKLSEFFLQADKTPGCTYIQKEFGRKDGQQV